MGSHTGSTFQNSKHRTFRRVLERDTKPCQIQDCTLYLTRRPPRGKAARKNTVLLQGPLKCHDRLNNAFTSFKQRQRERVTEREKRERATERQSERERGRARVDNSIRVLKVVFMPVALAP